MANPYELATPGSQIFKDNPLFKRPDESPDTYKTRVGLNTPTTTPAVVTSQQARTEIAKAQTGLQAELQKMGTGTAEGGTITYQGQTYTKTPDGSYSGGQQTKTEIANQPPAQPKPKEPAPPATGIPQPKSDYDRLLESQQKYAENMASSFSDFQAKSESIRTKLSTANQAVISSIRDSFARQIEETKKVNDATLKGLTQAGIRAGRNRYAIESEDTGLANEMREGIRRISDLEAKRDELIAKAELAQGEEDWKMFYQQWSEAQKTSKEMNDSVLEMYKLRQENEKAARESMKLNQEWIKNTLDIQDKQMTGLSYSILGQLTGDPEADKALISNYAEAYDLDPEMLAGRITETSQRFNREEAASFKEVQGGLYDMASGEWVIPPADGGVDSANFKEVQGGLYNVATNQWVVPPQTGGASVPENIPYGTQEYFSTLLKNSAGGKNPASEERTSLAKAFLVIDQIDTLRTSIDDTSTGPILGLIRSRNPYDQKAQEIQAQLTALIPNLARGVFGEVGVLTDNDVKLYAGTLPNLKSTEDVRNAVLGLTLKTVQRSIENRLEVMAASNLDVSGFAPKYNALTKQITEIEAGLGVGKENATAILDQMLNGQQVTPLAPKAQSTQKQGWFDSFLKQFNIYRGPKVSSAGKAAQTSAGREVVANYDITTYATDPNHGINVKKIYDKVSQSVQDTAQSIDSYIQKVARNSPIRGSDVVAIAKKYNVDPKMMIAIMQQDSSLGTKGLAVRTKNPGNVGNDDEGNIRSYEDWPKGVEAVAQQLAKRKIS